MSRPRVRRPLTAEQRERKRATDRERARRHREHYAHLRDVSLQAHLRVGWSELEAVEAVYWVPVHLQVIAEARDKLRAEGHRGRSFEELARRAWDEEVDRLWVQLEDATRGALFSRRGQAGHWSSGDLFRVNPATARAIASEEVRRYWDEHGRPTFAQFRARLLGETPPPDREVWVA